MWNKIGKSALLVVSLLAPFVYLGLVWQQLPETIPVHFDEQMQPDRYGNKSELFVMVSILAAVSLFVYVLLTQLPRIDPKYRNNTSPGPMEKLALSMVVFMGAIGIVVIYSTHNPMSSRIVFVLLGLLFSVVGYFIRDIKPNYFAGVRLPWTLESAENWTKTHLLTGKLWIWGGILFVVGSHLVRDNSLETFFLILVAILVIVPTVYSFWLFKQEKNSKGT